MLKLSDFRSRAKGLPDLLTYAALIDPGIVLQKDGSFLAAWEIRGQDTASSTPTELAYMSERFSSAVKLLGTGWMLHVDACRDTQRAYPAPERSHFPDRVSRLLDDERRAFFGQDICYRTSTFLTVTWLPNFHAARMAGAARGGRPSSTLEKTLETFRNTLLEFEDACSAVLSMQRLAEYDLPDAAGVPARWSELLAWLQSCLTGTLHPMRVPHIPMYLDAVLGSEDLTGGLAPRLGNRHLAIVSIDGLPQESWPAMLAMLDEMPFELRYSTRFICLDQYDAEREVNRQVKGWNQRVLGFMDQFLNNPNPKVNRDALAMREDAEDAKTEVQSGIVGAGYLTSCIVLLDKDTEVLAENARTLRRVIQAAGFGCRIETVNALEAWLGSLPGNSYANLRRPIVNTLNLADLLPLQSVWTGQDACPCPFYPPDSPPLAVFLTDGSTPFWFNLHEGDRGHTLVFGPTGAGKSTLIAEIAWNFRRYANARIFAFDKGMSLFPLAAALGGSHYEIGTDDRLAFAPLQHIDQPGETAWAAEWLASLLELQNVAVLPAMRNAINTGLRELANQPEHMRSLTNLLHLVPDMQIREDLAHFTLKGAMGSLLDAESDTLGLSSLVVFEVEELMKQGDRNLIPVLTYLFHRIEQALDGRPTLLILDEAWIMLGHPVFRAKIREWLKVLRKANCAVLLATQALSDARNSGIIDVLVESCPTKIYLPNAEAMNRDNLDLYQACGLNDRQIGIITHARPKRDYYMVNAYGRRLFQLGLRRKELAFVGASDKESIARIKALMAQHGPDAWQEMWMNEQD